jgi:hypothetical protein
MGEYWKPVNLTKKQSINPHAMGCGLKRGEWHHPESGVMRGIVALLAAGEWEQTDTIVAVSDYGDMFPMQPLNAAYEGDPEELYRAQPYYNNQGNGYTDVSERARTLAGVTDRQW